ncbi:MAG: hypothetical protein ACFE0P_03045 [Oceanicaulis sp.]
MSYQEGTMATLIKAVAAATMLVFASGGASLAQEPAAEVQIDSVEALIGELLLAQTSADALNAIEASTLNEEQIAFAFGAAFQLSGQAADGAIQSAYRIWLGNRSEAAARDLATQFAAGVQSAAQGTAGGGAFFGGAAEGGAGGAGTGGGGGASPT